MKTIKKSEIKAMVNEAVENVLERMTLNENEWKAPKEVPTLQPNYKAGTKYQPKFERIYQNLKKLVSQGNDGEAKELICQIAQHCIKKGSIDDIRLLYAN